MSGQSPLEQFKSARISKSALIALIAGIVAGLGLGLLIGWVWWPVEWQGAAPTAGIAANPALQANYVAAVADAYAASNTPEAARLAADRMQALGGDPRTAVDSAVKYFADQPGGAARIANLATMASAIGVPVTAQIAQPALTAPPVTVTPTATAAATPAAQPSDSPNWFAWLLVLLTALVLIGGGIYLLWRVAQKQRDDANGADDATATGFADEEFGATATTGAFSRSSLAAPVAPGPQAPTGSTQPPLPARAAYSVAATARPADPYAFDDEDDEGPAVYRPASFQPADGEVSEDDLDIEDEQEDEQEDGVVTGTTSSLVSPNESAPQSRAQAVTPTVVARPPGSVRLDRYTTIDSHTATYQAGVFEFDFTKNVENPDGSGYIGEYGIGISERHGILNNNLDQVVAIEVYLFDKSDENNLSTTTRALLSEYAHDNLYKYFEQEKPITLQKNTPPFQLEGRKLLLDCTVKDVKYTRDGVFQSVTVDLKLMQKN